MDVTQLNPRPPLAPRAASREAEDRVPEGLDGFVAVYEEHYRTIATYVFRRLGDHDLTEELTADIFLRAYENRRSFRGKVPIRHWLLGIATNAVYRKIRRRKLEERILGWISRQPAVRSAEVSSPHRTLEAKDELHRTRAAINSLPEGQQAVVSLHCFQGLSLLDTADALNIAIGTAKSRLSRARESLRAQLDERGEDE